jgi:hypothetical protein
MAAATMMGCALRMGVPEDLRVQRLQSDAAARRPDNAIVHGLIPCSGSPASCAGAMPVRRRRPRQWDVRCLARGIIRCPCSSRILRVTLRVIEESAPMRNAGWLRFSQVAPGRLGSGTSRQQGQSAWPGHQQQTHQRMGRRCCCAVSES